MIVKSLKYSKFKGNLFINALFFIKKIFPKINIYDRINFFLY